jgi:hypothetical protein
VGIGVSPICLGQIDIRAQAKPRGTLSVRDWVALGMLPDDEWQQWWQLWDDVDALLKNVEEKKQRQHWRHWPRARPIPSPVGNRLANEEIALLPAAPAPSH